MWGLISSVTAQQSGPNVFHGEPGPATTAVSRLGRNVSSALISVVLPAPPGAAPTSQEAPWSTIATSHAA